MYEMDIYDNSGYRVTWTGWKSRVALGEAHLKELDFVSLFRYLASWLKQLDLLGIAVKVGYIYAGWPKWHGRGFFIHFETEMAFYIKSA